MKNIKSIIAVVVATLCVTATIAQDHTAYFMTDATTAKDQNAAIAPDRGYFNLPLLGGFSISTSGNMSISDMLYPIEGELVPLLDTRVSTEDALSGLKDMNSFSLSNKLTILGFGKYTRKSGYKNFWSFDLSLRTSFGFGVPYEFFDFAKSLPSQNSIQNLNISLESYAEASFGYSRVVSDKLTVGGRLKVLAGLAKVDFNLNNLNVNLTSSEWAADVDGSLDIYMKGLEIGTEEGEDGSQSYNLDDLDFSSLSAPAGMGVAIDLGATYQLLPNLTLSAAVNDIGFISWGKANNTSAKASLSNLSFGGADMELSNGEAIVDEESTSFDMDFDFSPAESKTNTSWLEGNIKIGGEYSFLDNRIGAGLLYSTYFYRTGTECSLTGIVTLRPTKWFTIAGSYEFISDDYSSFGLALNIAPGGINIYLSTNILTSKKSAQYIPINQTNMNFTFGLGFTMGKKGLRREGI